MCLDVYNMLPVLYSKRLGAINNTCDCDQRETIVVSLELKWLRYQRVISLETQVGITNQRNIWANMDPRIYRRWDQVLRRNKHPLSTGHTRREPSFMSMNAALSAVKVGMRSTV
jgi:hypothetical protein